MKAVIYKRPFEVAVENVPDPEIKHPNDVKESPIGSPTIKWWHWCWGRT
ncbi:MAG TPA: hypothetical protein EYG27_12940 [Dehalococcoidia bacterium]|nr:hypothetical protein [Dehalococcoidia bacterium]HIL32420.1 hypothetical protein [Dehalococcoidia bacterium]